MKEPYSYLWASIEHRTKPPPLVLVLATPATKTNSAGLALNLLSTIYYQTSHEKAKAIKTHKR